MKFLISAVAWENRRPKTLFYLVLDRSPSTKLLKSPLKAKKDVKLVSRNFEMEFKCSFDLSILILT